MNPAKHEEELRLEEAGSRLSGRGSQEDGD